MGKLLELGQLRFDFVAQLFSLSQRAPCCAGALDMTPYQFVRVQVRGIAREEWQNEAPFGRCDIFLYQSRLVRWQAVEHQMDRLSAVAHHLRQQVDEQLGVEPPFIGAEPKRALGIHRRGSTNGLALTGALHHRRLATNAPRLAMHRIGTESGFVPEEDFGAFCLRLPGNGREGFSLPFLDGCRIALISPLQRLLRRQPQSGQHFADGRQPNASVRQVPCLSTYLATTE